MLLYGAARDPATCKPTKDSEIAAARLRAPRPRSFLCPSSSLYSYGTRSRIYPLSIVLIVFSLSSFPPIDQFNLRVSPANIVFTAIRSTDDMNLARSFEKVIEITAISVHRRDTPFLDRRSTTTRGDRDRVLSLSWKAERSI